jgi:hypothetical protein
MVGHPGGRARGHQPTTLRASEMGVTVAYIVFALIMMVAGAVWWLQGGPGSRS